MAITAMMAILNANFQNWVVEKFRGCASPRRMHDMGIDGYDYKNTPIQVKQSDIIGRNVVENFEEVAPDAQQILGSCELIPQ